MERLGVLREKQSGSELAAGCAVRDVPSVTDQKLVVGLPVLYPFVLCGLVSRAEVLTSVPLARC
jgi:hypothetical protein